MFFTFSCSRQEVEDPRSAPQITIGQWFDGPREMSPLDRYRDIPVHYFFDPTPAANFNLNEISYVQMTPRGSAYSYQVDLVSGKLYRRADFCTQEDVFQRGGTVNHPPMHIGFVPRLIDELGSAQRIYVFGQHKTDGDFRAHRPPIHRVRVIGGVREDYCDQSQCLDSRDWLTRLILIAVVPYDSTFSNVFSISDLANVIDWEGAKIFIENYKGRSAPGEYDFPAYRLRTELASMDALQQAFARGHYFEFSQMQSLRRTCHRLYNYTYRRLSEIRESSRVSSSDVKKRQSQEESSPLLSEGDMPFGASFSRQVRERAERHSVRSATEEMLDEWLDSERFHDFFRAFLLRYGRSYRACMRYVRPSNFQEDRQRHWTMGHVNAFFALERLGYVYNCANRSWALNNVFADGSRRLDYEQLVLACSSRDLDMAFTSAMTMLTGLRNSGAPHYHYIRYDMGAGGSHEEIFSWVESTGKELSCRRGSSRRALNDFPAEERWFPLAPRSSQDLFEVIER